MPSPNPKDSPALGQKSTAEAEPDEPFAFDGPPVETDVWEKYNKRMEFPVATVAAVLVHIIFGVLIVFGLFAIMNEPQKPKTNLKIMNVGGIDDAGEGSAGSGGVEDPAIVKDVDPFQSAKEILPTEQSIADAKAEIQKTVLPDATGSIPIAAPNAAAISMLDESIRKKLLGARQGAGGGAGRGDDGSKGSGPGGTGADSTRARGLRWVLRFRVSSGRDYVDQLKAMGAEILIPLPPDGKRCALVSDLSNPSQKIASDADMDRLAGKIQFGEPRKDQVKDVCDALKINAPSTPTTFWACFPEGLEEELARKETGFRNRRAEDIEMTIFRIVVRGGKYELIVDEQKIKK